MSPDSSDISLHWVDLDARSDGDGLDDDSASIVSLCDDTASIVSLSTTLDDSDYLYDSDGSISAIPTNQPQELITPLFHERAPKITNATNNVNNHTDSIASPDTVAEDLPATTAAPEDPRVFDDLVATLSDYILLCEDQQCFSTGSLVLTEVLKALHSLLGTIKDLKEVVSYFLRHQKEYIPWSKGSSLGLILWKWSLDCSWELDRVREGLVGLTIDAKDNTDGPDGSNPLREALESVLPTLKMYEPLELEVHR